MNNRAKGQAISAINMMVNVLWQLTLLCRKSKCPIPETSELPHLLRLWIKDSSPVPNSLVMMLALFVFLMISYSLLKISYFIMGFFKQFPL